MAQSEDQLEMRPLTPDRWQDLEALFGERGATAGCWCMWFRLTSREFDHNTGTDNHAMFQQVVQAGSQPGVLAYRAGKPVGWCAVAPRSEYPRYATSRVAKPVDDHPVWVISCLFIDRHYRRQGLTTHLIKAAVAHAASLGAAIVEAYPVDTQGKPGSDSFLYHGIFSAFQRAGFTEVARRTPGRPVMRRLLSH